MNRWQIDDIVVARGAVVRRFFRGASGFGSSTEVVVVEAELVRHRAKSRRLVSRAVDRVGGLIDRQTDP